VNRKLPNSWREKQGKLLQANLPTWDAILKEAVSEIGQMASEESKQNLAKRMKSQPESSHSKDVICNATNSC